MQQLNDFNACLYTQFPHLQMHMLEVVLEYVTHTIKRKPMEPGLSSRNACQTVFRLEFAADIHFWPKKARLQHF